MSKANARGFTLVELMVAQALGLVMMTVLVASLSSLYQSVQVSADAAENSEVAYFLMDALEHWLSESRSPMLKTDSLSFPIWAEGDVESMVIDDPCGTPIQSPFDFTRAGVALIPAVSVSCLPYSSVNESSKVLLIERRVPCHSNCREAGFYVALSDCSSGDAVPEWRSGDEAGGNEAGSGETLGGEATGKKESWAVGPDDAKVDDGDDKICDVEPELFQLHRVLIYVRNYYRRRGDGVPALMISRLATEPEPRWLRSDMLAGRVFEWDLQERMGTHRSRAVVVGFSVKGRHRSTSIRRAIPVASRSEDFRPPERLSVDLAWP